MSVMTQQTKEALEVPSAEGLAMQVEASFVWHLEPERAPEVYRTVGLGYVNQGATLSVDGMLFVNRSSWAHAVDAAARLLDVPRGDLLTDEELAALDHRRSPEGVIIRAVRG